MIVLLNDCLNSMIQRQLTGHGGKVGRSPGPPGPLLRPPEPSVPRDPPGPSESTGTLETLSNLRDPAEPIGTSKVFVGPAVFLGM